MAKPKKGKYSDSLKLPQTDFAMRGNLAKREPDFLARWEKNNLTQAIEDKNKGNKKYILHDGPPYANGHIHYGHILNKILKDLVLKFKSMTGHDSPYVPGWDTHGLPIEVAVEQELGEKSKTMSRNEIRQACKDYALKYIDTQKEEFKRLGVFGKWDDPYLTLQKNYEASIVKALASFAKEGYLYRGKKPVHWCPTLQTALAEAEIEYKDIKSPSIYVRFAVESSFQASELNEKLDGKSLSLVIWTTTPWTLPANLAVVLGERFEYVAVPSPKDPNDVLILAKALAGQVLKAIGVEEPDESTWVDIPSENLKKLEGISYQHPFIEKPERESEFKIYFADHVTVEAGTGLVHTAPGHGADDYKVGVEHGLRVYAPITGSGHYTDDVKLWEGKSIWQANKLIPAHIHETGHLLNEPGEKLKHSYPHNWRSKTPVIFRATDQWFLNVDHNDLRKKSLSEIKKTAWIPPWGENRINGMIEKRPDWVLSRQRLWGVPIPTFSCNDCESSTADGDFMSHVAEVFEKDGADAWYENGGKGFIPEDTQCSHCGSKDLKLDDSIVDVWFESGCSWLAVCQGREELDHADLYLEGSDQHRGWFHSSLLVGIGMTGKAPYKSVLTHGFVLDDNGVPYSKSAIEKAKKAGKKSKYIPPDDVIGKFGAEILRLWVSSTEFRNDIPYSQAILTGLSDFYRKFRNTSRFILGNLGDFDPNVTTKDTVKLNAIDLYALDKLEHFVFTVKQAYENFQFHHVYKAMADYMSTEVSSFYLDVTKDRLYCDKPDSERRKAAQYVLYQIGSSLTKIAAPILCFTAEDVWDHLPKAKGDPDSIHLTTMPSGSKLDEKSERQSTWSVLFKYRDLVASPLEEFRAQKNRAEQAVVTIAPPKADHATLVAHQETLRDVLLVSQILIESPQDDTNPKISIQKSENYHCERCRLYFEVLAKEPADVCKRCSLALN